MLYTIQELLIKFWIGICSTAGKQIIVYQTTLVIPTFVPIIRKHHIMNAFTLFAPMYK